MSSHRTVIALAPALLAMTLPACGPAATEGGFDSPNPAARMYAIEEAARTGDGAAIPSIIGHLGSDDPAVRMLAISTLERLTGETLGYRHYDSAMERHEAIERWIEAEGSGRFAAGARSGAETVHQATSAQPSMNPQPATGAHD